MTKFPTAIGTVVLETDWYPLLHFFEQQRTPFPALEEREVVVRVALVDEVEIRHNDPPDTYPRTVYVERSRFVISRDRIEGEVPRDLPAPGILIAWLWGALPILCAPEGWECLHAAAVETDGEATLIVGGHDTGKTTAALDFMTGGAHQFADDRVLVNGEGIARAWSALLHADPRTAQLLTGQALTQDAFGKVWIQPPSAAIRNQAHIAHVYTTGGVVSMRDDGPGWDSTWVNNYGVGKQLLEKARTAPTYRLNARVAITNRNPWRGAYAWDGGDMSEIYGWVEGLRANGIEAEFVPYDELHEEDWDLIHLWHVQYPWSYHVATHTTKPLVVTAITQGNPPMEDIRAAVLRSSAVLCYSQLDQRWYQERFPELNGRFRIMPQGVPEVYYQERPDIRTSLSVFQAGRYLPVKNQLATLKACRILDVPVVFAGMTDADSGPYLVELRRAAAEWKGARFFGILKGETLYQQFRTAYVHCQPSQFETCGASTREALAFGCNIVYTNKGFGPPVYEPHGSICEPSVEGVQRALEYELKQPRDRHGFRPPTWQRAVRVAIPWYREALEMEAAA